MSSSDLFVKDYPHGTPTGYDDGCRGGACPGAAEWGLSCKRAKTLSRGDYRYQQLARAGHTPAEIADELGLIPEAPTAAPKKTKPAAAPTPPATKAEQGVLEEAPAAEPPVPTAATASDAPKTASISAIRAWARERGYTVKDRGILPQHIVDHYKADHPAGNPAPEIAPKPPLPAPEITPKPPLPAPATAPIPTPPKPTPAAVVPRPNDPDLDYGAITTAQDIHRLTGERDRARSLAARLEQELARSEATRKEQHTLVTKALQAYDNENTDLRTALAAAQEERDRNQATIDTLNDAIGTLNTALETVLMKWGVAADQLLIGRKVPSIALTYTGGPTQ